MTKTEAVLDFPSGPIVGTQSFQCRGVSSIPCQRTKILYPSLGGQKKKTESVHTHLCLDTSILWQRVWKPEGCKDSEIYWKRNKLNGELGSNFCSALTSWATLASYFTSLSLWREQHWLQFLRLGFPRIRSVTLPRMLITKRLLSLVKV